MGSRTLPWECHHGVVQDWGDFGPDDDTKPDPCPACEAELAAERAQIRADAIDVIARSGTSGDWRDLPPVVREVLTNGARRSVDALLSSGFLILRRASAGGTEPEARDE